MVEVNFFYHFIISLMQNRAIRPQVSNSASVENCLNNRCAPLENIQSWLRYISNHKNIHISQGAQRYDSIYSDKSFQDCFFNKLFSFLKCFRSKINFANFGNMKAAISFDLDPCWSLKPFLSAHQLNRELVSNIQNIISTKIWLVYW